MIKDANAALKVTAEVFHGNFSGFQKDILESVNDDLLTAKGEMRNLYTEGNTSVLFYIELCFIMISFCRGY